MPQPLDRAQVTGFLKAWGAGNDEALQQLMPVLHDELRRLAASYMRRERRDHTLQVTGLVNEAYLRLIEQTRVEWQDRHHFFGVAAQCMRRVLVDYARQRHAGKRGGDYTFVELDDNAQPALEKRFDLIDLDEALATLADLDERQARVVEMRFFGGLSIQETADVLKVSSATVKRDWDTARIWLTHRLGPR